MESTSPVSRRNQGKLAEAIQSMSNLNSSMDSLELPTDPDAQATVTDFLDFTEYLPSDMIRSLTLIGNLDQTYASASSNVDGLTKKYGALPTLPLDERADPVALRADISQNLSEAVSARTSAHAEASRMAENVDRHYNRAKNILAKLQDMMEKYPSSREASPAAQKIKSPVASRSKLVIRNGEQIPRIRKHRAPRITVPGEVLAPYELDYESYGSSTEEEQEAITPRATPARSLSTNKKIMLKINKPKKDSHKAQTPRPPRPPGGMGTNVHSAVAGISTSNALAMLEPPPADAPNGSEHKPWLQLTSWELTMLRKKMKKNAVWSPSDTMISRELVAQGRGIEAYRQAKADAEAQGIPFDSPIPPQLLGETVHAEGAMSVEAINAHDTTVTNKGMKMNQAKKIKKEQEAKEAAKLALEEAEESARKFAEKAKAMKGLFNLNIGEEKKTPAKATPAKAKAPPRKRKREDSIVTVDTENPVEGATPATAKPLLKRTKTETPIPVPIQITKQGTPHLVSSAASVASELSASSTPVESTPAAALPSPKKPSIVTPILPPKRDLRKPPAKTEAAIKPEATPTTRTHRSSAAARTPTPTPEPSASSSKRPSSARSNKAPADHQSTVTIDRPRRASTARNTPAPAPPEPRQPSKRAKRPAPGIVAPGSEGSSTVTASKRSAATRKKAGPQQQPKKEKKEGGVEVPEIYDEIDDEGNVIDPNEARYCLCNRVSFGVMICCENDNVSFFLFDIPLFRFFGGGCGRRKEGRKGSKDERWKKEEANVGNDE